MYVCLIGQGKKLVDALARKLICLQELYVDVGLTFVVNTKTNSTLQYHFLLTSVINTLYDLYDL